MADKNQNLAVNIAPEVAGGKYANLAIIGHSSSEFCMDFASVLPGAQGAHVQSRIIMAPEHAKRLLAALQDNIKKYENQFGEIALPGAMPVGAPMTFGDEA